MATFAFVSDFDGTLTQRDFYHIIIDKYLEDWGRKYYEDWKRNNKINVEFLNKIFGSIGRLEEEIREDIHQIPIDEYAVKFIKKVQAQGGRFYILSAGTSYYIEILLEHLGIKEVTVISMKGCYKNGGIEITPDPTSPYYSEVFGLNKRQVIEDLKKEYDRVFFAGDSEPDLEAAKASDLAFAKSELKELLLREKYKFVPFEGYRQIDSYMDENGWE